MSEKKNGFWGYFFTEIRGGFNKVVKAAVFIFSNFQLFWLVFCFVIVDEGAFFEKDIKEGICIHI